MNSRFALIVLAAVSGSLLAFGFLSSGVPNETQRASPLSTDDAAAMRTAATGARRSSSGSTDAEPAAIAAVTEVVTISEAKFQNLAQKGKAAPDNRGSLMFALQRELARVGCYDGEINGAWTAATRQAMKVFLERVNATLPITQPDSVHLALIQSQAARVCDSSCPPGQGVAGDGRCMHSAVLSAEARKRSNEVNSSASGWSTTTTVAPSLPSSLSDGQMALAGPKPEGDQVEQAAKPIAPSGPRSRPIRENSRADWRAELWKRQN
jgi:hypothetical protein